MILNERIYSLTQWDRYYTTCLGGDWIFDDAIVLIFSLLQKKKDSYPKLTKLEFCSENH